MANQQFMNDINLTCDNILQYDVPRVPELKITTGLMLEIASVIQNTKSVTTKDAIAQVLSRMTGLCVESINVPSVISKLHRKKLAVSKLRGEKKIMFLLENFSIPTQTLTNCPKTSISLLTQQAESSALSTELSTAKGDLAGLQKEMCDAKIRYESTIKKARRRAAHWYEIAKQNKRKFRRLESACAKLKSQLLVQKKRRLTKKTAKIQKPTQELKAIKKTYQGAAHKKFIAALEKKKAMYNLRLQQTTAKHSAQQQLWEIQQSKSREEIDRLSSALKSSENENRNMTIDNQYLQTLLDDNAPLELKKGKTYTPDTVHCVLDILGHNVSASQVGNVIRSVAQLCGRTVAENELPHRSTVDAMRIRGLALSHQQLNELKGDDSSNLTLYTDETRKRGKVYMTYAVTSDDLSTHVLGVQETPSKSAQDTLDTMVSMLHNISETTQCKELGEQIIVNIKNTMSDRASTEKLFNELFFKYRAELVPKVVQEFERMSPEQQQSVIKMNNFFCGLHLTVSLADDFSKASKAHEGNNEVGASKASELRMFIKKSESAGVRFVRTACKLFAPGGEDHFGAHEDFSQFVAGRGKKNILVDFRHNRFNILFYDGAVAYHLASDMHAFITSVHGTSNSLLKAVMLDAVEPVCLAGARTLGLLSKTITSPLWRVLEDDSILISDIGCFYGATIAMMIDCLEDEACMDAFITGQKVPTLLTDYIHKDDIWDSLVAPHSTDLLVKDLLLSVFRSWVSLLKRLVSDHLPTGCFSDMSPSEVQVVKSTKKHNKLCEEIFGHLDRLIRLKPRATTLTHESHIIYQKNRISQWLGNKDDNERERLIEESRSAAQKLKYTHSKLRYDILQRRKQSLQEKQGKVQALQRKIYEEKEKLTSGIVKHGLWQTCESVDNNLKTYKSVTAKLQALKLQLQFRRTVLGQPGDKLLFQMSSSTEGKYSVSKVTNNLKTLISAASTYSSDDDHVSFLVGKRIQHKFKDNEDNITWYSGLVISQVPGFEEWFNVVYDGDEAVYTFRLLDDLEAGDLELAV